MHRLVIILLSLIATSVGVMPDRAAAAVRCTIVGTPGPDVLHGTSENDVICGMGGRDVIDGGAGSDVLRGGSGRDALYGRGGADHLVAGDCTDALRGGPSWIISMRGTTSPLILSTAAEAETCAWRTPRIIEAAATTDSYPQTPMLSRSSCTTSLLAGGGAPFPDLYIREQYSRPRCEHSPPIATTSSPCKRSTTIGTVLPCHVNQSLSPSTTAFETSTRTRFPS